MGSSTLNRVKDTLWALAFAGLVATILRFGLGLGTATGLNDATPWGLWIAFKLGFVALAGGGFTLAGLVYVFHLEVYRPLLRRAILLALLGYGSFIVSLLFDLGLPWHIYMPIINWQHHSVMFEIAWCVMLYFSVLIMEFGPVILEYPWFRKPIFQRIARVLHLAVVPLVIGGIVLSTLHQSSLGALFLIMPHRVHPLWYSSWIPVLFFTSAIAAGLMALVIEGFLAERLFGRGMHFDLLKRVGRMAGFTLWLYLGLRIGDLLYRGVLPGAFDGSWQSLLFGIEVLVCGILPAVLLMMPKISTSRAGLLTCSLLVIAGVLSQRMSLSMITLWRPEGAPYLPSLLEILIAFAIPAAAGLVYFLFSEHLSVIDATVPERPQEPPFHSQFDPVSLVYQNTGWQAQVTRRSSIAVVVIALTIAALPTRLASGQPGKPSPVEPALGWENLKIDGDRAGMAVDFPHLEHQERLTAELGSLEDVCASCHHLNHTDDEGTGCWECHQDNVTAQSIFNHNLHTKELGGNASCPECHEGEHRAETAVDCVECHEMMIPAQGEQRFDDQAPSYQDAMHGSCLECHEEQAVSLDKPELAGCSTCHYEGVEKAE